MPCLSAQFQPKNVMEQVYADMDDTLMQVFRDMAKIARGEIAPHRIRQFASESIRAAYLIAKPDVGG